jgi:2-polyprenyl-3-methyl-5-hydroxy-6-metoxy-1,4-benzoquinol methylase
MTHWLTMPVDCKKEVRLAHGTVYRCRECAYGALMPRPDPAALRAAYELDRYYTHGASHFAPAGRRSFFDRLREHLAWRLERFPGAAAEQIGLLLARRPADICDIGCGAGELAAQLAALGHRVLGVELDAQAAAQAARRGVEVLQGSAERLPSALATRQFDLVILSHVLEHCLDPLRAVRNAHALLRPGGFLCCEVPNNACAGFAHAGLAWEMLDIPRHVHFFVAENLRALAASVGLEVKKVYYARYARQFKNDWINTERRIYDALVRTGAESAAPRRLRKNSRLRAWALLARTAFARDEIKYDSVGIVAAKPCT